MRESDATTLTTAKRLKAIRIKRELTQVEIADKAKMNANYYAKIERGEVRPSLDVYERLAKVLKVSSSDLFPF